jgi:hypothetical protein
MNCVNIKPSINLGEENVICFMQVHARHDTPHQAYIKDSMRTYILPGMCTKLSCQHLKYDGVSNREEFGEEDATELGNQE